MPTQTIKGHFSVLATLYRASLRSDLVGPHCPFQNGYAWPSHDAGDSHVGAKDVGTWARAGARFAEWASDISELMADVCLYPECLGHA
jgi:hypothetical protein